MFDTLRTIRWYFRNTIQIWALLCLLMAGGLSFYNYLSDTLTLDRGILIITLSLGMWVAGRILLLATRKEVEKEINHLIEYEALLENEISTTDLMQFIPVPALLLEIDKEVRVKDTNKGLADLLGKKCEEMIENRLNDLHIPALSKHDEILQTLLATGKVENKILSLQNKSYTVWGYLNVLQQPSKALLLFVPTSSLPEEAKTSVFDHLFYEQFGHDVFDAINAILGFTMLLEHEIIDAEKKQQYLQIISVNARKVQWLISNYLQNYFKENYPLRTATDIENLNLLLDDMIQRFNKEIPNFSRHINLFLSKPCDDEEAFLIIDNQLIYQLFLNLIMFLYDHKNQMKIEVSYAIASMHVKFIMRVTPLFSSVINVSKIVHFFDTQKPTISNPKELNLYLFKKLIDRIAGKTEVSLPDDETVLISFTVPAQTRPVTANNPSDSLNLLDKTILFDKHILVVEDIDYNRMLLNEYLTGTGAILHFASSGQEAIEFCKQYPYTDIILLDIQLPDTDGFQLINELKKYCPRVVVIAQTAYTSAYDKKRALEAGFNYYLSKPLKQDMLLKALTHAVQKHLN